MTRGIQKCNHKVRVSVKEDSVYFDLTVVPLSSSYFVYFRDILVSKQ